MAKVSRPIIYAVVLGAIGYGAFILTEPTPPPKKKKTTVTATAKKDTTSTILPEDLKAHFEAYTPKQQRNPFLPRVVAVHALAAVPSKGPAVGKNTANWVLTGITAINNKKSALLENSTTGDSVFLQPGDKWNGMRVMAVGDANVHLVDASGRLTALGFPEPTDTPTPGATLNNPAATPNAAPNGIPVPTGRPAQQLASGPQGGVNGI